MQQPILKILLALTVLAAFSPFVSADPREKEAATASPQLINCYDAPRGMVMRMAPNACQGRQVSDAEAAAIRARRRAYVRESLEASRKQAIVGKRLTGIGSGFFVNDRGTLLTSAHVVQHCTTLTVSRPEGAIQPARLLAIDRRIDLALLATDFPSQHHASFAPADAPLPTEIAVVGYPNQGLPPLIPVLTPGVLPPAKASSTNPRPTTIEADVRPGNSGGPLLDYSARVIGVVFAAVDTPAVYQRTGRVVRNVGMAIPNSLILPFLARHDITPATSRAPAKQKDLLATARNFVSRIECWQ